MSSLPTTSSTAVDEQRREEDRLMFKWFFSPKRLTEDEKQQLKFYVNVDRTIKDWIREEINKL